VEPDERAGCVGVVRILDELDDRNDLGGDELIAECAHYPRTRPEPRRAVVTSVLFDLGAHLDASMLDIIAPVA
jgi:hypothetical protein